MNKELALHIVLQSPPRGHDFGLQKGSGNNYETVQIQRSAGGDLHFSLSIPIRIKTEQPIDLQFLGPFVQGPANGKFIYIDIGALAGQAGGIERRLKIPLYGIDNGAILQAINNPALMLETYVAGTHKNGGPNCATVKPFDGWKLVKSNPV